MNLKKSHHLSPRWSDCGSESGKGICGAPGLDLTGERGSYELVEKREEGRALVLI